MGAESPGVLALVERMRTNRPAGVAKDDERAAFIFKDGLESAMEEDASARHFTLMLAGRAKNIAPVLAERVDLSGASCLLDVGAARACMRLPFCSAIRSCGRSSMTGPRC